MLRLHRPSRRRFLRGTLGSAAVTVGLPLLDAFLDTNGTALAAGGPIPTRFGVWFFGNGVKPDRWIPSGSGTNWSPSPQLAPLGGLKPYVSVATGCEIKNSGQSHHTGMATIMTGRMYHQVGTTRDTIVSTFGSKSMDVVAADHLGGETPYRSLEVAITRFRGTDEGTTFQHLSHNGPNNPNPSEYAPKAVYNRLFGMPLDADINLARLSALDAVRGQVRSLHDKVGTADRIRLEQHFESIRALEKRLASEATACSSPMPVGDYPDMAGKEQIEPRNQMMTELVRLALACDMTRVFSVLFSPAGSGVVVWPAGANNSMHQICHDEPNPQPTVHRAVVFTMQQLAHFLKALRDTPEGDGNLLKHSSIFVTSELSDGWNHSNREFPILIAGQGGGRLRSGVHYRGNRRNTTDAVLTALRGAGVGIGSFGAGSSASSTTIGELMA